MTSSSVPSKELRLHWGEHLDRVLGGESFVVTRNGRPAAVLSPPVELRSSAPAEVEER